MALGTVWEADTWAADAWADGAWANQSTTPAVLRDLSTLLVAHLGTLYDATPNDLNAVLAQDIPTVRADADSDQEDLNTDYSKYLS